MTADDVRKRADAMGDSSTAEMLRVLADIAQAAPGVIRVADRSTMEFDALRYGLARLEELPP